MSTHSYDRQGFLDEFFPGAEDQAEIAAGMEQLRAEQRASRSRGMSPPPEPSRL